MPWDLRTEMNKLEVDLEVDSANIYENNNKLNVNVNFIHSKKTTNLLAFFSHHQQHNRLVNGPTRQRHTQKCVHTKFYRMFFVKRPSNGQTVTHPPPRGHRNSYGTKTDQHPHLLSSQPRTPPTTACKSIDQQKKNTTCRNGVEHIAALTPF